MKLLHAGPSPFVRKVMVLLEETGRAGEIELIDGFGSPTAPNEAVTTVNPLGKIPCLIRDEGPAIYDSRVITRYLNDLWDAGLYRAGEAVWSTLTLEAHADGLLDAGVLCVYETRCRDESERSDTWREGQRAKIARGLDALEQRWMSHLHGPMDMGCIGVGCALGYLDFRAEMGGFEDWRTGRPQLTAWGEAFMARPSMKATAPA